MRGLMNVKLKKRKFTNLLHVVWYLDTNEAGMSK